MTSRERGSMTSGPEMHLASETLCGRQAGQLTHVTTPGCGVWRGGDSDRKDAAGNVGKSSRQISNCTSQICGS